MHEPLRTLILAIQEAADFFSIPFFLRKKLSERKHIMAWAEDLETIRHQKAALDHHRTIFGYTQNCTRDAIKEMRSSTGAMSEVMHQRADECEEALDALIEFHNS